jgi:ribosomal protein L10
MQKKKSRIEARKKKYALWGKLWNCVDNYKKILLVSCHNIGASIFHDIRQAIRPFGAVLVMGKNVFPFF